MPGTPPSKRPGERSDGGQMFTGVPLFEKYGQKFTGELLMYRGQHKYLRGTVFTRRNNFINFSPGFVSLKPGFHL